MDKKRQIERQRDRKIKTERQINKQKDRKTDKLLDIQTKRYDL